MSGSIVMRIGRPPGKRDRVVAHMRQLIVSGKLKPGARMPTHEALKRRCAAESPTIRAAMRILGDDGFIETLPRRGTYVAAHPPHLAQIAFVFPFSPDHAPAQFYAAIRAEALRRRNPARRVLPFYDIESHTDVEDYQRLLRYVQSHCLAGLIFASNPFGLRQIGSPLTQTPGVSRVIIEANPDERGVPVVCPESSSFLPKAFDHLAARGCKRVAVVQFPDAGARDAVIRIPALAAERGLTVKPQWIQAAAPDTGGWIRQLGCLLVQGQPGERPDAMVITDDNLVPELTAGLASTGLRIPDELAVVAHTNFPHPTPSAVPVTRLGYDVCALVATCIERIDQQQRGEKPPAMTLLPTVFEWEVSEKKERLS